MESNDKFEPKGEDKIREEVIAELGLDPESEDNKPIIDKLVAKELQHQKNLGKAIQQKQDYRKKLEDALKGDDPEQPKGEQVEKKDALPDNVVTTEILEATLHRNKYPNLSDEEYQSINALAKASGKSFEDTIENNPVAKTYFESSEAKGRLSRVIQAPSTRTDKSEIKTEEDKIAEELSDDLPQGFSLPKK